jgi:alpha-glucosidase
MRFWLDKGVAGFRLDAIPTLFEDEQLRNEPELGGVNAQGDPNLSDIHTNLLPEVHDVLRRMRRLADSYPGNRVLIGETYLPDTRELLKWYGAKQDELHLPMDMLVGFHSEGGGPSSPNVKLNAAHLRTTIGDMATELGTNWPLLVFDNHDNERSWDRFGDGLHNSQIAKIISTLLLTSRASALIYYGEEIGMVTSTPTRKEDVKDPIGTTGWPWEKGRDGERTPMQWTPGPQAGFSTSPHTWLPIPPSYQATNVEVESNDPDSQLNWFRTLAALRRSNAALHGGSMTMLDAGNRDIVAYARTAADGSGIVVAVNCSREPHTIKLDLAITGIKGSHLKTLATSDPTLNTLPSLKSITLSPFASWVAEVQ